MVEEEEPLSKQEKQLIADILYTFMNRDALEGIASIDALIKHTITELK